MRRRFHRGRPTGWASAGRHAPRAEDHNRVFNGRHGGLVWRRDGQLDRTLPVARNGPFDVAVRRRQGLRLQPLQLGDVGLS